MATTPQNIESLSPLKRAYLALEKVQARLESVQRARREPIAVLGMGCRYPGGVNDPQGFWELLAEGRDAISEVPANRWDIEAFFDPDPDAPGKVSSRYGGFIGDVEHFDAAFFGISPREAESLDPQQRLLLEATHEAFEHAGLAPDGLVDSQTGVFVGIANGDYYTMISTQAQDRIDAYLGTGTSPNAAAGRLSYVFGLRGPCLAIDTACSSSLVALHLACQSLRNRECDMAVAGGVNVMLSPGLSITFSKAHMLCADGRCKTFDAEANGYVRGEGVGAVVLKRLSDARADGDRILAVIRGSAINQDGPSSGLTVPNGPSQQDVIRRALALGELEPEAIDYIEAHGTGTALGDPIELGAIGGVFGGRSRPLWIGSVKTNVGHLEGAAGIAGVMKTVLALQHEQIPPHLHFKTPSPRIPWQELPVEVAAQSTPWPRSERPRLAGVSSFGFSGINAHVVVEEAPAAAESTTPEQSCHLLLLSGRSRKSLRELAGRYVAYLGDGDRHLGDVCYTAALGRSHYEWRLAVVADSLEQAETRLEEFLRARDAAGDGSPQQSPREGIFVGTGEGSSAKGGAGDLPTDDSDRAAWLAQLAERYVAGAEVARPDFAKAFSGRKVSLPTYPFDRRRFWIETTAAGTSAIAGTNAVHPLLGHRLHSAAVAELVQFESLLSARQPGYLAEHQIAGTPILPASAYLEIALVAAREVEPRQATVLTDVALEQAMQLAKGQSRVVQVALKPDPTGRRFELYSRPATSGSAEALPSWTRHATGRIEPLPDDRTAERIDLEQIQERCGEDVPLTGFYERMEQFGLQYGPSFRGLQELWRGEREVLGRVELPEATATEAVDYLLHPALLDACLHVTVELLDPRMGAEADVPVAFVPVGVQRLERFSAASGVVFSHARLRDEGETSVSGRFLIDVDLIDADGRLVARLTGLKAQRVDLAALSAASSEASGFRPPDGAQPLQSIAGELAGLPPSVQRQRVAGFLEDEVVRILKLGRDEPPAHGRNLFELGIDSLMSVEFLYRLNGGLGVNLSMQKLLDNPAIGPLADAIVSELGQPGGGAAMTAAAMMPTGEAAAIDSPWLPGHRGEPGAAIRLFCFHPPGAAAAVYAGWPEVLRPGVEVCAVQLPGSGTRADEPPIDDWATLVETVAEGLLDFFDRPFAFFGHGAGGLLAYDVAHHVQSRFGLGPAHLFVAASSAPGTDSCDYPLYVHAPKPPLDCSITALAAKEDAALGREAVQQWYACTQGGFRLELLPGTFAQQLGEPTRLLKTVADDLRTV